MDADKMASYSVDSRCGCKIWINFSRDELLPKRTIEYCPLHAAAPEMAERIAELEAALQRQRQGMYNLIEMDIIPRRYHDTAMEEIAAIDKALSSAEGDNDGR
jgi:hypothetical protein